MKHVTMALAFVASLAVSAYVGKLIEDWIDVSGPGTPGVAVGVTVLAWILGVLMSKAKRLRDERAERAERAERETHGASASPNQQAGDGIVIAAPGTIIRNSFSHNNRGAGIRVTQTGSATIDGAVTHSNDGDGIVIE